MIEISSSLFENGKLFSKVKNVSIKKFTKKFCILSIFLLIVNVIYALLSLPSQIENPKCPSMIRYFFFFDLALSVMKIPNMYFQFIMNRLSNIQIADNICFSIHQDLVAAKEENKKKEEEY